MSKIEFLDNLRRTLKGEIPDYEINKHVNYYDEYITQSNQPINEVLEELGDPRLIAKTIIDTYTMSHSTNVHDERRAYYEEAEDTDDNAQDDIFENKNMKILMSGKIPLSWKIAGIVTTVALVVLLFFIGKLILNLAFGLFLPVVLVIIILQIIQYIGRKR